MFKDLFSSLKAHEYWTYSVWLKFGLTYRKTSIGPLWLVASPAVFVGFLGYLFSQVNGRELSVFVPHLAIGYVTWTLIYTALNASPTIFTKKRSEILQGQMRLTDLVLADIFQTLLTYLHQMLVVVVVFIYFGLVPDLYALVSLIGLFFILLNSVWVYLAFGMIGARFRDLDELISAGVRLGFFITPIIWMPVNGQGGVLGAFLILNPIYHFLEIVRAPLLGNPIAPTTWAIVIAFTLVGYAVAAFIYRRTSRLVPLWV